MGRFTVRIELHNIAGNYDAREIYETLHQEAEKQGLSRIIINNQGVKYHLPDAEYNIIAELTNQQVLDRAKTACRNTLAQFFTTYGDKYSILVTGPKGRRWFNLDIVQ